MLLNKDAQWAAPPDAMVQIKQLLDRRLGEEAVKPPPISRIIDFQRWMICTSSSAAAAVIDIINNMKLDCVTRRRVA